MSFRFWTSITTAGTIAFAMVACQRARVAPLAPVACSDSLTTDGRLAFGVDGQRTGAQLPAADWRRAYVGSWSVSMTLDSVQAFVRNRSVFRPVDPSCSAVGSLAISDTLLVLRTEEALAARLELDVSKFRGGRFVWPGRLSLRREGDKLTLDLCPGCFDTGVWAILSSRGDSLIGTWSEMAYVGHFRAGRIVLWRKDS
jgi:hypothetical protein